MPGLVPQLVSYPLDSQTGDIIIHRVEHASRDHAAFICISCNISE